MKEGNFMVGKYSIEEIKKHIEDLREKLENVYIDSSISDEEKLSLSQGMDKLLNEYTKILGKGYR